MFGAAGFALFTIASSWSLGRLVDRVVVPTFDPARGRPPWQSVAGAVATYLGLSIGRSAFTVLRRGFAAVFEHSVSAGHRSDVTDRLLRQPYSWVRRRGAGDLLAAADNDPEAAVGMLPPLPFSFGSIVLIFSSVFYLFAIDVVLGATALVVVPLLAASNIMFVRKAEEPAERIQAAVADLTGVIHETVDGIAVVKVLGAGPARRKAVDVKIMALRQAKVAALRYQTGLDLVLEVVPALMIVVLLLVGSYRVRDGVLTVGQVVTVVQLFERLMWPLRMLAYTMEALPRSVAGKQRIDSLINEPVPLALVFLPVLAASNVFELTNVGLVYDDGRVALDSVNLVIARGSRVAVVGSTGSGKSTLLHVLAGLDAPSSGLLRRSVDAAPILVFQEPLLFTGTIEENIQFGTKMSTTQQSLALDRSSATEFVSTLASGVKTLVGERGVTLSGGQRQRIALARAIARQPNVLLLDDTTSSLDPATEAEVLEALRERTVAETVVLVAARPSSIALADLVVFMEDGRVVASGSHDELFDTVDGYRAIVSAYSVASDHGPLR